MRGVGFSPALGNVDAIIEDMRRTNPSGSTPTAMAIDIAGPALLAIHAPAHGRALVLATDGAPGCNNALDPNTCTCISNMGTSTGRCEANRCLDDVRTISRLAHFADAGLPTYVMGIQSETDQTLVRVLNDLAVAGGRAQRGDAGTRYYAVSSRPQLDAALVSIRDQVGACVFLAGSVPDREDAMTVTLPGGGEIEFDPTGKSGWTWGNKTNGELFVSGAPCDEIIARMAKTLEADVACDDEP